MSQSKVFCKLELHALRKKTVLKISHNPGLNLTVFLGTGPRYWPQSGNVSQLLRIDNKNNETNSFNNHDVFKRSVFYH